MASFSGSRGKKKKAHPPTVVLELTLPDLSDNVDPSAMVFDYASLWEAKTGLKWDAAVEKTEDERQMEQLAKQLEAKYGKDQVYGKGKKAKPSRLWEEMDVAGMGYDKDDPFIDDSEAHDELLPSHLRCEGRGFYVNSGPLRLLPDSDDDEDTSSVQTPSRRPPEEESRSSVRRISSSSDDTPLSQISSRKSSPTPNGKDKAVPETKSSGKAGPSTEAAASPAKESPVKRLSQGAGPSHKKTSTFLKERFKKNNALVNKHKASPLGAAANIPVRKKKRTEEGRPRVPGATAKAKEAPTAKPGPQDGARHIEDAIAAVVGSPPKDHAMETPKETPKAAPPRAPKEEAASTISTPAPPKAQTPSVTPSKEEAVVLPAAVTALVERFSAALNTEGGGRSKMGDATDDILVQIEEFTKGGPRKIRTAAYEAVSAHAGCQVVNLKHRLKRRQDRLSGAQEGTPQAGTGLPNPVPLNAKASAGEKAKAPAPPPQTSPARPSGATLIDLVEGDKATARPAFAPILDSPQPSSAKAPTATSAQAQAQLKAIRQKIMDISASARKATVEPAAASAASKSAGKEAPAKEPPRRPAAPLDLGGQQKAAQQPGKAAAKAPPVGSATEPIVLDSVSGSSSASSVAPAKAPAPATSKPLPHAPKAAPKPLLEAPKAAPKPTPAASKAKANPHKASRVSAPMVPAHQIPPYGGARKSAGASPTSAGPLSPDLIQQLLAQHAGPTSSLSLGSYGLGSGSQAAPASSPASLAPRAHQSADSQPQQSPVSAAGWPHASQASPHRPPQPPSQAAAASASRVFQGGPLHAVKTEGGLGGFGLPPSREQAYQEAKTAPLSFKAESSQARGTAQGFSSPSSQQRQKLHGPAVAKRPPYAAPAVPAARPGHGMTPQVPSEGVGRPGGEDPFAALLDSIDASHPQQGHYALGSGPAPSVSAPQAAAAYKQQLGYFPQATGYPQQPRHKAPQPQPQQSRPQQPRPQQPPQQHFNYYHQGPR